MKIDERAIGLFKDEHWTLQEVGDFFGVTRQGVKKFLNKRGIDTSSGGRVKAVCDTCGVEFEKFRKYFRQRVKNYCSTGCYYKSIENPEYIEHRQGARNARKVLLENGYRVFGDEVVHHIDGNQDNNDPNNLMVFKNHSDHMKFHRNGNDDVVPVWPVKYEHKEMNVEIPIENDDEILAKAQAKLEVIKEKAERPKGMSNSDWQIRKRVLLNRG